MLSNGEPALDRIWYTTFFRKVSATRGHLHITLTLNLSVLLSRLLLLQVLSESRFTFAQFF